VQVDAITVAPRSSRQRRDHVGPVPEVDEPLGLMILEAVGENRTAVVPRYVRFKADWLRRCGGDEIDVGDQRRELALALHDDRGRLERELTDHVVSTRAQVRRPAE